MFTLPLAHNALLTVLTVLDIEHDRGLARPWRWFFLCSNSEEAPNSPKEACKHAKKRQWQIPQAEGMLMGIGGPIHGCSIVIITYYKQKESPKDGGDPLCSSSQLMLPLPLPEGTPPSLVDSLSMFFLRCELLVHFWKRSWIFSVISRYWVFTE